MQRCTNMVVADSPIEASRRSNICGFGTIISAHTYSARLLGYSARLLGHSADTEQGYYDTGYTVQ